ncbi:tyrosine-protein phosphatase 10D-like, partial [Alosa alosa]|uniref:tyrosine-protein phosphatase 10D-like n=1 Tax=Alosa alosa TaxID=278164 RepID=UPI00201554FE
HLSLYLLPHSVPPDVTLVNAVTRSETHLDLEWTKVDNNNNYTYVLRNSNGAEASIIGLDEETRVKHTVSSLSAGTKYSFTLFTVFEGVRSTGYTFSEITIPPDVAQANVATLSETHLELEWTKVNNDNNYNYILRVSNGAETNITGSDAGTTVKHTVASLSAGTNYSFTLFTVFEGVSSTGFTFSAVTVPSDVTQVNVVTRSETHLQLEWSKVNNDNNYNYILRDSNGAEVDIAGSDAGTTVKHTVSSLSAGTNYSFTLFTVFDGVRSTGRTFSAVTVPPDVTLVNAVTRSETHLDLEWTKVDNNNNYTYVLRNSNGAEASIIGLDEETRVKHTVSSLSAGTKYSFTLFTVFEGVRSTGYTFSEITIPPDVAQANVATLSETHLELEWTKVNNDNNYNYILRVSNGAETNITGSDAGTTVKHTVASLSAGTNYSFTLFTVFEGVSSTGFTFSAVTVPSDVTQVNVVTRSETHLQLEWSKVNNDNNYNYILRDSNGAEVDIAGSDAGTTVKHTFDGVRSTGRTFSAVTVPPDVTLVNAVTRSETHLDLEWTKVDNNNNYTYVLRNSNGAEASIIGLDEETRVKHTVSSLSAGTKYSFTLFTVFEGVRSTGYTFSEITIPPDVAQANVATLSETHLELEWTKVNNDNNYNYILRVSNGAETNITGSDAGTTVKHTVASLSAGTNYSFTLFTVFEGVSSTGFTFSAVTVPSDVTQVNVVTRSETHLQLEWSKVNNDNNYNYILRDSNGAEVDIAGSDAGTTVKHTVSSLSAGTNYSFTLFTVFDGVRSTGRTFSAVTVPPDVTLVNAVTRSETHLDLEWTKVDNNNNYTYVLRNSNGAEASIIGLDEETRVKHTVSSLSAGTKYSFTLFTVFEGVRSTGYTFSEITIPPDVAQANVATLSETHLELEWTKVNNDNNYNYILRVSNGAETNITGSDAGTTVKHTVASLSAGTNYSFTLFTVFEGVSSTGFTFSAVTVPSDVTQVNVVTRSETHLQLEWSKVNNDNNYNYILRDSNGAEVDIAGSDAGTTVKHTVSSLSAGTNYSFTLFTVFDGVRSTGRTFSAVTVPPDVTLVNAVTRSETHLDLEWTKVDNNNNYTYTY